MFFVDEIHRMPRALEETFYPAMEDRQLPITVGQGAGARVVTLDLPPFTLIGATTRAGLLTTPLRDRFGIQHRLDHYGPEDLARIVMRSAACSRSRSTRPAPPRSPAAPAARRATPTACSSACATTPRSPRPAWLTETEAEAALDLLEVDHEGLDRLDRELLAVICEKFGGGPVGLSTLAVAVGEEHDTIEDVYEPYLLQTGLSSARPAAAATARAWTHLGCAVPPGPPACSRREARLRPVAILATGLAHMFICPNCGNRSTTTDRTAGFRRGAQAAAEVRLRLPLRADGRLLPRARRRLLRLRQPEHG